MNEPFRWHSRLVHRLSVLLTIAVFPLIWVGGLVTTYDAGMAVPDWPGTYGWNMFAYPATTWLYGPFDLLVEHSHRLLGTVAGLISIMLVIIAFLTEPRRWFRWWTVMVLVAVVAQGALGGARVLLDERTIALIHGCIGPLFFGIATATAVMSSRWWFAWHSPDAGEGEELKEQPAEAKFSGRTMVWGASALVLLAFGQLIFGAQLRHATGALPTKAFTGFVHLHLTLAGLICLVTLLLGGIATFSRTTPVQVKRVCWALFFVVCLQITLGIGTWIVNYALPWSEATPELAAYTIEAKGYWESMVVTAHMATGSLLISFSTVAALRAWRSRRR